MTTVLKKIQSAVDEGGTDLKHFAAAAGVSSSEFAKVWKEQPIQALDMFIKGLAKSSGEGKNLTTILDDLGIKGIRESDTILRMAGASDLLSEAVKTSSDAWEENTALTNEAEQRYKTTESQLKMLWNRIKDVGITLGEALIPAAMDAIDAAEPLFNMIEKGAKSFSEMSKEEQQTILKTVGLVAALGPLSFGLGSVFKIIGTVSGGMSKLIGRIGKVSIEMGGATKSVGLLGSTTKASSGSLKGLSGATATAGKNLPKFTGLLGKAGGAIRGLGSLAPVAGRGLMSLAGPFGLLATVAIPELIKGGISLVNHLKEDSIPALNDFGDNVSEATAEAVLGYKKLNDEATTQLNQLLWSQEEITPEIAENLTSTFSEMGGQIKESLKADFDESYKTLSNFFTNSKTLSKDEQQAILDNMKAKQDEQQKAVADSEARIKEIMDKASQEKRALTQAEKDEINRIQQEMMTSAIQTMSNGEVEQKAILERLKQESGNITALQAAETVQNSLKAKEGAIKEANQKYDEVVKWAIRERDESGSITAEQADKIIKDAARQRDESIKKAEEMHNGVVEQAKKQAKGQVDEIDWSTGEVLSNWDKMVRGVAKAVNAVSGGVNWVLDKIGVDKKIPEWKPKGYAIGTPSTGHPGGPAIVGEKGPELAYVPGQGVTLLGAKGPELHTNLPKGTAVLPNKETERMLKSYGFPGYENGVGDFFKWALEGPKKLMGKVWEKFPIPDFNVGGSLKDMGKGIVNFLKDNVFEYVKKKIKDFFSFDSGSTGNIGQWIGKAIAITGVPASWFNPLVTIAKHESGGNPRAINLWDTNAKRGIPSQGLMQTVPPTFKAYKLPGLDDILNPVHNAVAAINYIKSRYGSVFNVPGIKSLARGGKYIGYATGGIVKNDGLYRLAEEGWPEFVIPTAPNRRTEAMKLLALAGKEIGNKRPNQLPNVASNDDSILLKLLAATLEQNEILKRVINKPEVLEVRVAATIDKKELSREIAEPIRIELDKLDTREQIIKTGRRLSWA